MEDFVRTNHIDCGVVHQLYIFGLDFFFYLEVA